MAMIAETFAEVLFAAGDNEDASLAVMEVDTGVSQALILLRLVLDEVHGGTAPSIDKLDAMLNAGIARLGMLGHQVELLERYARETARIFRETAAEAERMRQMQPHAKVAA